MNRTLAVAAALGLSAGCVQIRTETRIERGALLRTFDRERAVLNGGVRAHLDAAWPQLTFTFSGFDTCKTERVEEYAEDHILERSSTSSGPALATGVPTTAIGLGLLAARGIFSNAPNTRSIDASGHYGASDRALATGWSVGLLIVGVPALVVGVIGIVQTGEETEVRKAEQVVSANDAPCHGHPVSGAVEMLNRHGPAKTFQAEAGKMVVSDAELRGGDWGGLRISDQDVLLAEEELALWDAYQACVSTLPGPPPAELAALPGAALTDRLATARRCVEIPGVPVADALKDLEAEVARRGALAPEPAPPLPQGPLISSFEQALAAYAPQLRFDANTTDLRALTQPEGHLGEAVVLEGIFLESLERNIVVLEVAGLKTLVFLPGDAPWPASFPVGSRVEAVGVLMGHQTLGTLDGPLVRAVWMRTAL